MKNPRARRISLVSIVLFAAAAYSAGASPVDFGRAELARALQERGLSPVQMTVSIRAGTPESWSLTPKGVVAADERGAMYALLEATEQIRREGRLAPASGRPATPMRGIRVFLHNKDQQGAPWGFALSLLRIAHPEQLNHRVREGEAPIRCALSGMYICGSLTQAKANKFFTLRSAWSGANE